MSLDEWKILPKHCKTFDNQIAGHGFEQKNAVNYQFPQKFVTPEDGHMVLKPVQAFPKGQVEVAFYQNLDETFAPVKHYIPKYFGIFRDPETNMYYIGMENIFQDMQNASIIDLKIGRVSFSPDATPAKKERQTKKYQYREEVGFLISGVKIVDCDRGNQLTVHNYKFGRDLNLERVYREGILPFLGSNVNQAIQIAQSCHDQLQALLQWFRTQKRFSFYSSSIILAHGQSISDNEVSDLRVIVKWVDFTHVYDANCSSFVIQHIDENFLFGLNNLLHLLSRVQFEWGQSVQATI